MSTTAFGTLTVTGGDRPWQVKCDRLATDKAHRLLFASVVADAGKIKGIRALLGGDKRLTFSAEGIDGKRATQDSYQSRYQMPISKMDGGYRVEYERLDYGLAHAFIMTRNPTFLPNISDANLWATLTSTAFTTPLLVEWMPYLREALRKTDLLEEAKCKGCACGLLTATTAHLDGLVTLGLRKGKITIPSTRVVG